MKETTEEERIKTYKELIYRNSHIAGMDRFFKEVTEKMLSRYHKTHDGEINDLVRVLCKIRMEKK